MDNPGKNTMRRFGLILSLVSFGLVSAVANAAIVTKFGTDVKFTYDDSTLFGDANVVGNNIFFLPTSFSAESLNGAGAVSANSTLVVTVEATTVGYSMNRFLLIEQGDYFLNGTGASVSGGGQLRVTSNTTNCLVPPVPFATPCTDNDTFTIDPMTVQGAFTDWDVLAAVDLADTADWLSDTSVKMMLENRLTATTFNVGEEAFIEKKFGAVGITVIPVPAAVWLFGSGLMGLLGWSRRRVMSA